MPQQLGKMFPVKHSIHIKYFGRLMVLYNCMNEFSDIFVFFVIPVICPCVELARIRAHGSVFAWQTQAFFVILWGKISSLRICYSVLPGMYIVHMHFFQLSSFVKSGFLSLSSVETSVLNSYNL